MELERNENTHAPRFFLFHLIGRPLLASSCTKAVEAAKKSKTTLNKAQRHLWVIFSGFPIHSLLLTKHSVLGMPSLLLSREMHWETLVRYHITDGPLPSQTGSYAGPVDCYSEMQVTTVHLDGVSPYLAPVATRSVSSCVLRSSNTSL